MSIHLTDVAIKQFEALIKHAYQAEGFMLRGTMRERTKVTGNQIQFVVQGKGVATQKAIQDNVTPMNIGYTPKVATMSNWNASEYTDIFAQAEVNFDEKMELATTCAMAIGRRMDQIAINALIASGTTNTIAEGGTGFIFDKVRSANYLLRKNNVRKNNSDIHALISAGAESDLMAVPEFTNKFFLTQDYIKNGELNGANFMGIKWHVLGDMDEGGLPLDDDTRSCFMWDKQALGYGIGIDLRTTIDWIAEKRSYLVSSDFKAASVAIDPVGIIKIDVLEPTVSI